MTKSKNMMTAKTFGSEDMKLQRPPYIGDMAEGYKWGGTLGSARSGWLERSMDYITWKTKPLMTSVYYYYYYYYHY